MKKSIWILAVILVTMSCKTASSPSKEVVKSETSPANKQQMENLENGIYFRGAGNDSDWSLKISNEFIEFTSSKSGFESFKSPAVAPVRAMDANVKMYRVATESGTMSIQIMQQECVDTKSGEKKPYSVRIEISKNNTATNFNGCGNYITDYRLNDIWVLEKMNGETVTLTDFIKKMPDLEINSSTNRFSGFAGCNRMNGSLFFESGLLRFTNVVTTRMACFGTNKEADFLKALQSSTTYKIENRRLTLSNPSGEKLVFKKVD